MNEVLLRFNKIYSLKKFMTFKKIITSNINIFPYLKISFIEVNFFSLSFCNINNNM